MPTNRTRKQRGGTKAGLQSWLRYCGNKFREFKVSGDPWTDESAREFYDQNKAAIIKAILAKNIPFFRPVEFWQDLESKHPRVEAEKETWRPSLEEISNGRYLNRLGLLEPWEKQAFQNMIEGRDVG